jgi:hypothetical protein
VRYGNDDQAGQDDIEVHRRVTQRRAQLMLRPRRELARVLRSALWPADPATMSKYQMALVIAGLEDRAKGGEGGS